MHFGIGRVEKHIVVRKEPAVAIIPAAKFRVASLYVAEIRFRQLHGHVVIVEIPERVTIDRKYAVFVESSFKVQILDAAVNLIARKPVFLFELRAVATRDDAADSRARSNSCILRAALLSPWHTALPRSVPPRTPAATKVPAKTSTRNLREAVFITLEISI